MKKVVLFGGGTGLSNLLKELKELNLDMTIIVATSDNGGSTGKIRKYYDIPAPGDLRKVLNTFIDNKEVQELFEYRFDYHLEAHTIGNLLLTALVDITGDMTKAVNKYREIFNIEADIYPISNTSINLNAKMSNSKIVVGEKEIVKNKASIKKVFYNEDVIVSQEILGKIENADYIILSPGSLYTSLLPNLIIKEIVNALKNSMAKVIYISNIMTQKGETDDYDVAKHIEAIEYHTYEGIIDTVIANNCMDINTDLLEKYQTEDSYLVKLEEEKLKKLEIYSDKLIKETGYIRHDFSKVVNIFEKILNKDREDDVKSNSCR